MITSWLRVCEREAWFRWKSIQQHSFKGVFMPLRARMYFIILYTNITCQFILKCHRSNCVCMCVCGGSRFSSNSSSISIEFTKTGSGIFNNSIIVGRSSEITLCIVGNPTKWKIIHLRFVDGIPISIPLISSHKQWFRMKFRAYFWLDAVRVWPYVNECDQLYAQN